MIKSFIKLGLFIAFVAVIVIYTAFKSPNDYKSLEEKIRSAILVGDYKTAANLGKQLAIYGKRITDICYIQPSHSEDVAKIIDDDSVDFSKINPQIIYKLSQSKHYYVKEGPDKIPYITHHIWITDEKNPRELNKKHIKRMSDTFSILDRQNPNYVHYLWVNKNGLIPESIAKLRQFNIVVKEIGELGRFKELEREINYLKGFNLGGCSDLLRMVILEEHGGIYMDVDVWLKKEIRDLPQIHRYIDLLITYGMAGDDGFLNGFILCKKNHLLVSGAISNTVKILNFNKSSEFIKYACDKDFKIVYIASIALRSAFLKNYNQNKNWNSVDIFVPFNLLFDDTHHFMDILKEIDVMVNEDKIDFSYIGTYGTTGSWRSHNDLAETLLDVVKNNANIFYDRIKKAKLFFKEGKMWERIVQKLHNYS